MFLLCNHWNHLKSKKEHDTKPPVSQNLNMAVEHDRKAS